MRRRDLIGVAVVAVSLLVIFMTVPLGQRDRTGWAPILVAVVAFALFAATLIRITARGANLVKLVTLLLVVVIMFSTGFYAVASNRPGEFDGIATRVDALYFTLTTMTTTGYGDVVAVGQLARGLVSLVFVFDVVFLGLVGAELGRLSSSRRRSQEG